MSLSWKTSRTSRYTCKQAINKEGMTGEACQAHAETQCTDVAAAGTLWHESY